MLEAVAFSYACIRLQACSVPHVPTPPGAWTGVALTAPGLHLAAETSCPPLLVQDPMISQHEVIEAGPPQHRCQVVRWVRSFPFSFIKEREYYIARR